MTTIRAPAKPFKLTYAHNAIYGIYNQVVSGSGFWGVSVHSLQQSEGYAWVVHRDSPSIPYPDNVVQKLYGIAVYNYWLYVSSWIGSLHKWKVDAHGYVESGSMVSVKTGYEHIDIRIYENEIYCLDTFIESDTHIRVYDFDFNFVREFSISSTLYDSRTMAVRNGLIYIDDRNGYHIGGRMKIYTTTGDFVETVDLNLGSVNTIN